MHFGADSVNETWVLLVEPGDEFDHGVELCRVVETVIVNVKLSLRISCAGCLEGKGNKAL